MDIVFIALKCELQADEASSGFASSSMPFEEIMNLKTRVAKLEDFVCKLAQPFYLAAFSFHSFYMVA